MTVIKTKIKHLHKYKRTNLSTDKLKPYIVFKCIEPYCTHYMKDKLVEGKLCLCNRCDKPMIMDKVAMTMAKPHCADCTKSKIKEVKNDLNDFLKNKGLD